MLRLFGLDSSAPAAAAHPAAEEQQVALSPDARVLVAEQRIRKLEEQLALALQAGHERLSNLEKWRIQDLSHMTAIQSQLFDARAEAARLKEQQAEMAARLEKLEAERADYDAQIAQLRGAIVQERHQLLEAELAQKEEMCRKVHAEINSVRNGSLLSMPAAAGVGAGVGAFGGPPGILIGALVGFFGAPFIYIPVKRDDLRRLCAEERALQGRITVLKNLLHPPAV